MDDAVLTKTMPHSTAAENSVIGAMLIDQDAIGQAAEIVTAEDFYQNQYKLVFNAIVSLYNEGKAVDVITLQNRLKEMGASSEVTELSYVSGLVANTPNSANVQQYAKIVADTAQLRRLIHVNKRSRTAATRRRTARNISWRRRRRICSPCSSAGEALILCRSGRS